MESGTSKVENVNPSALNILVTDTNSAGDLSDLVRDIESLIDVPGLGQPDLVVKGKGYFFDSIFYVLCFQMKQ